MNYTVQKLAKMAGISVRALHYYDEIGLLKPSFIKENGYRYYGEKQVLKLQQILFFKELEFQLEDIQKMVNADDFDTNRALKEQRKLLAMKKKRLETLIHTIDKTLNSKGGENKMQNDDLFNGFSMKQLEEYKEEAKQRWGNTDAYKQSMERTKHWTKEDYNKATENWKKFNQELADTMDKGFNSPEFQALIAKQHESINAFYDCSPEMFKALADMYVQDPRFRENYDKFRPGLAEFMKKAIYFYCESHK